MSKNALYLLIMVLATVLVSCHSNEQNYKLAYDKAMEKYRDQLGVEEFERIQAEKHRATAVVNGDSVRVVAMHTNVFGDSVSVAKRYGVVVAQFKQKFNATTMRDRLRKEEGYPSYVLFGGPEKKYFVIVKGFDELDVAAAFLKTIDTHVRIKVLEPVPWIIERI